MQPIQNVYQPDVNPMTLILDLDLKILKMNVHAYQNEVFRQCRINRGTIGVLRSFWDPQLVGVQKFDQFRLIHTTVQDSIRPRYTAR